MVAASRSPASRVRAYVASPPSAASPRAVASSTAHTDLVGAGARPARAQPLDALHAATGRRSRWRAPCRAASSPSTPSVSVPGLDLVQAGQLGGEGVPGLAGRVAGADQPGQPRALQPRADQGQPALGGRPGGPGVEGVGRDPARAAVGTGGRREQPGGRGHLDQQRGGRLVDVQLGREGAQVADAETAAAQGRRAAAAPTASSISSTRRTASKAAPAAARSTIAWPRSEVASVGRHVDGVRRRAAAAQRQADLAGQHHGAAAAGHQQPVGEQLLGRGRRRPRAARSAGRRRWSPRRPRRGRARAAPGPAATARRAGVSTSAAVSGSAETGRSPLTPGVPGVSASATVVSARRPCGLSQASARSSSRSSADAHRRRVAVRPRPPGRRRWFDRRRRGHQGHRARTGSAGRARAGQRTGWPHATRAGRSREGPEWRDRGVRGADGTAVRPASRGAGRRACGTPSWTSLPRYRAAAQEVRR